MRGGTLPPQMSDRCALGLSPHARGNLATAIGIGLAAGPIPACAGEPLAVSEQTIEQGAYPRMRGGTDGLLLLDGGDTGLSPHARGNRKLFFGFGFGFGPIPACAGEPTSWRQHLCRSRAYPRMRGGTLFQFVTLQPWLGLSPHARGNRAKTLASGGKSGPIPACAGEPRPKGSATGAPWAYPRMRGGTSIYGARDSADKGLSPHARGNLLEKGQQERGLGPIPACAGEPTTKREQNLKTGAYPRMRGGTWSPRA